MKNIVSLFMPFLLFISCSDNEKGSPGKLEPVFPLLDSYTELAWEDDFTGKTIDTSVWVFEPGGYWGYGEFQEFTAHPRNSFLEGGKIIIQLRKETGDKDTIYTSSCLSTRGKKHFQYGRYDIRAKMPFGEGILALFAIKQVNDSNHFIRESETIDVFTSIGKNPGKTVGTLRFSDDSGKYLYLSAYVNKEFKHPKTYDNAFNLYTLIWEKNQICWYINGEPFYRVTPESVLPYNFGFDRDGYLIMNLTVGGKWAGEPTFLTSFPQKLEIDYIKYFKESKAKDQNTKHELNLPDYDKYTNLLWSDEFDNNYLDTSIWIYESGDRWANNEIQAYTEDTSNSFIRNSNLIIRALKTPSHVKTNREYTSARLITMGNMSLVNGRIDVKARMPFGQGIWPAIWMLPTENKHGSWPFSGEIDILEVIGHEMDVVHSACHYGENCEHHHKSTDYHVPFDLSDDYHVYSLVKEKDNLWWYFDGTPIHHVSKNLLSPHFYPFNEKFYLILNIAVGGSWPGYPDSTTIFPQTMEVDYVRIFSK